MMFITDGFRTSGSQIRALSRLQCSFLEEWTSIILLHYLHPTGVSVLLLKGHSQLEHMRTRYHFKANLHITETRSILLLIKNDKNNIID